MNKLETMKPWLFVAVVVFAMGFTACSSDDDDEKSEEPSVTTDVNPDKGKDNVTDMAVTGGVSAYSIGEDDNIAAEVSGYLNISDELKATLGLGVQLFGVEISTDKAMPANSVQRVGGSRFEDNRKFMVTIGGLQEKTPYYYRTFFGAGETFVYGSTESFTTPSIEDAVGTLVTPDVSSLSENNASISPSGAARQIAYTTDKAKLTEENIKNGGVLLSDGALTNLESGITYYYCAVRVIKNRVVMGPVKDFTTKGFNVKELAKYVTADVTYDETAYKWKVQITTTMGNQYQGKGVKYEIYAYLHSTYSSYLVGGGNEAYAMWNGGTGGRVYATGSGNSYTASVLAPQYIGTFIDDSNETFLEPSNLYMGELLDNMNLLEFLYYRIQEGEASEKEIKVYEQLLNEIKDQYRWQYYNYVRSYLDVIVEIGGTKYVVYTKEGKLRLPWEFPEKEKKDNSEREPQGGKEA